MTHAATPNTPGHSDPAPDKSHKRHILDTALVCFNEMGIQATTIETIRARASSSVGSIYHHFGNKDGLIAALFFTALDDQTATTLARLQTATNAKEAVETMVQTYLEWVTRQPELARFMFQARSAVADGPFGTDLAQRNKERLGGILQWLDRGLADRSMRALPRETYAALLIGQSENYCRAWLSERVKTKPSEFANVFSEAAWRSIGVSP